MSSNSQTISGGIGFFELLTILFIALKLSGYIDWSWWWVLSPIWIGFLIIFSIIVLKAVVSVLAEGRKP